MIVYMLKDGLGNQLFEYAYAKKLQQQYKGEKIFFCTFMYRLKNFSLGGMRQCSLQHLNLPEDVEILNGIKNLWYFFRFMLRLLLVYKNDFVNWFVLGKRRPRGSKYISDCKKGIYISENSFSVPKFVYCNKKIKFIFGNYESTDALPDDLLALQNTILVKTEPGNGVAALASQIRSTESVGVHIRRGDYLNPANAWLQVCDYEYYQKAIQAVIERVNKPVFYIFSNSHADIEWIKHNYIFKNIDPIYVDMDNADFDDLRLMQVCKHFIISNSTFSWWASFRAINRGRVIVSPKAWTRRNDESNNLLRSEFIKI